MREMRFARKNKFPSFMIDLFPQQMVLSVENLNYRISNNKQILKKIEERQEQRLKMLIKREVEISKAKSTKSPEGANLNDMVAQPSLITIINGTVFNVEEKLCTLFNYSMFQKLVEI